MSLSKEQLLAPRYKVIALWPYCHEEVGGIITVYAGESAYLYTLGKDSVHVYPSDRNRTTTDWYEQYPHLFQKLEWWEERKPEDMPEYVRQKNSNAIFKCRFDLNETSAYFMYLEEDSIHPYHPFYEIWEPATYTEYINNQTTNQ